MDKKEVYVCVCVWTLTAGHMHSHMHIDLAHRKGSHRGVLIFVNALPDMSETSNNVAKLLIHRVPGKDSS